MPVCSWRFLLWLGITCWMLAMVLTLQGQSTHNIPELYCALLWIVAGMWVLLNAARQYFSGGE